MDRKNIFLGLMLLVLGYMSYLMISPFLGWVVGAALLAFIMHPLHKRLRQKVGERVSAFSLMILAVVAALLPFVITVGAVLEDAQSLQSNIGETDAINLTEMDQKIEDAFGMSPNLEKNLEDAVKRFSQSVFGGVSALLRRAANFLIGLTLMLFLLYYFLKDGEDLIKWLKDVAPVEEDIQESYYSQLNMTTWAVIKGHVFVAIIQGLIAGFGLLLAGVPNYIFWTFIMVLLGFIPIIGTIIVWLPASIYLFLEGNVIAGLFLLVYGFTVVSLTDNIVRPIVVEKSADLHPAAIIIGVIGGLFVFGAVGMFIGPIIIGAFKSLIVVSKE